MGKLLSFFQSLHVSRLGSSFLVSELPPPEASSCPWVHGEHLLWKAWSCQKPSHLQASGQRRVLPRGCPDFNEAQNVCSYEIFPETQ